jgi:hypothetical protein
MRFNTSSDKPLAHNSRAVKQAVERFKKTGRSGLHSSRGVLLSHVLNYCVENKISFILSYFGDGGFYLTRSGHP